MLEPQQIVHKQLQKRPGGYRCPICNFRFSRDPLLQLHIEECIVNHKKALCNGCGEEILQSELPEHEPECVERLVRKTVSSDFVQHLYSNPPPSPRKPKTYSASHRKAEEAAEIYVNGLGGNPIAAKLEEERLTQRDSYFDENGKIVYFSIEPTPGINTELSTKLAQHRSLLEVAESNPSLAQAIIRENFDAEANRLDSIFSEAKRHWQSGVASEEEKKKKEK